MLRALKSEGDGFVDECLESWLRDRMWGGDEGYCSLGKSSLTEVQLSGGEAGEWVLDRKVLRQTRDTCIGRD